MTTWALHAPCLTCHESGDCSSWTIFRGPPYAWSYQRVSSSGMGRLPRKPRKYNGGRLAEGLGDFFLMRIEEGESLCRFAYLPAFLALRRSSGWRSRFRIRKLLGVTSTSSSGPRY